MSSRPRRSGRLACTILVAAAAAVHAAAVWGLAALWIEPDESTYGQLGRSLWQSGRLTIMGVEGPFYGVVYPAFAGLPLTVFGELDGVRVLQLVQPLVMSLAGAVVYAWASTLVRTRLALAAAALALALPAFVYAGLLMTEVVFYPIAVLALFAMARAIEHPTLERQAVAMSAVLLASLTRLQALALLPVLITAISIAAVFERSTRLLRRFAVTLGLLVVAAGLVVGFHEAGASRDLLGAYSTTAHTSYELGAALRWILWHAGDAFLVVAGIPLLATAVLVAGALRGRESSPAVRALLAVTVAYVAWSVVQVGAFASRFSGLLLERNLFTLAPLLFLGFAVWLERGAPRPQPLSAIAAVVVAIPAVVLPPARLADAADAPNGFTSLAFQHVVAWTSLGWTRVIWIALVGVLAILFLVLPRRLAWSLPVVTLALLVGASAVAARDVRTLAGNLRTGLLGDARVDWIETAADGPVTYLYDGNDYWNGIWTSAFWNPLVHHVVVVPVPIPGALPPHALVSPRFDGRLFTTTAQEIHDPYVLASSRFVLDGTPVATITQRLDGWSFTLWKVTPPTRLRLVRTGFDGNGDFSGRAQVDVYACGPGNLEVTLLGKNGSPVTVGGPGVRPQTVSPQDEEGVHLVLAAPVTATGGTKCTFTLDTPGFVGSTVIAFTPSR